MMSNDDFVVVGGGPAGALLATMLADAGREVVVYESRDDLRRFDIGSGRSINLTLAKRGIVALEAVGVMDEVDRLAMPLAGRMIHVDGDRRFHRYGRRSDDVIHSISRNGLNAILLDRAEATGGVRFEFGQRLRSVDFDRRRLSFVETAVETAADAAADPAGIGPGADATIDGGVSPVGYGVLFGADGSNSAVRTAMCDRGYTDVRWEPLDHGYKELEICPDRSGSHRLEPDALHIWPRNEFMLLAFANPDGSFTVTLFMPESGSANSFAALTGPAEVEAFFEREFPSFVSLVPNLVEQFFANPIGQLQTIRTEGWSVDDRVCLVGDSSHTVVPFHGQGMNLALESVQSLVRCLHRWPGDRRSAFESYERERKVNADAIADMALANYVELRSGVIEAGYLVQRELSFELERRWPQFFASRYDMVTFSTMPFVEAYDRSRRQGQMLAELTASASSLEDVDYEAACRLVHALGPLPTDRR